MSSLLRKSLIWPPNLSTRTVTPPTFKIEPRLKAWVTAVPPAASSDTVSMAAITCFFIRQNLLAGMLYDRFNMSIIREDGLFGYFFFPRAREAKTEHRQRTANSV